MRKLDVSSKPQESMILAGGGAARSCDGGGSAASRRAWFPPEADDFEITPEAAMYAGRR